MAPTEIDVILLAGLIIFSGHFVKGVSGFGSALFSVPLLMLILDVRFVTPVFLVFDFMSGAVLVASNYRSIHRQLLLLLLCGLLVGTALFLAVQAYLAQQQRARFLIAVFVQR